MGCESNTQDKLIPTPLTKTKIMKRALATVLSGLVLSTLIATSALAAESKPAQSTNFDPEQAYIEKYGC